MTHDDEDHGRIDEAREARGRRDPLDEAREALPRELSPPHDVWPSIHRAIARESALEEIRGRKKDDRTPVGMLARFFLTPTWGLVGATFTLACLLGAAVTWLTLGAAPDRGPFTTTATTPAAITAALEGLEYECARVHADLLALLEADETAPSEETRAVLLANLAIVRSAVAESRAALRANPNDALLAELTVSAYREQLAFLKGATRVPFRSPSGDRG